MRRSLTLHIKDLAMKIHDQSSNVSQNSRKRTVLVMLIAAAILGLGAVYLYGNDKTDGTPLMEPAPNGVEEVPTGR